MDMSEDGYKVAPLARILALVPVILIAAGLIAAMFGIRPEGRRHAAPEWRTHTLAEYNFAVAAPGVFIMNRQMMDLGGEGALAQTYIASAVAGIDFSVSAVRRPTGDGRPFAEVVRSLGLSSGDPAQGPGGSTMFRHDVALEGTRTQALLIFQDRMMFQMMVTAPEGSFPLADAERFFGSFRLLGKS
jgi:hypothetical protein